MEKNKEKKEIEREKEKKIRCFISINFPKEILDEIQEIQGKIKEKGMFDGKFTERENLHLTLKFLGELSREEVEKVKEKLGEIRRERFDARISEMGVFSPEFVRIIWVRVDGGGILELQKEIDEKLSGMFKKEERFMSHVTIARVKKTEDKKKLISELRAVKIPEANFLVRDFYLVKSELKKEKAEHEILKEFELN